MKIPTWKNHRRAWLAAALAVVFGTACVTEAVIPADSPRASDLRVDVQWRVDLASDRGFERVPREMGQPVLSPGGDLLVGASSGWVYRIRAHSGAISWGVPVGGAVDAPGRLVGRTVVVGTDAGEVVALDWLSGQELWRAETRGSVEATPSVASGRVLVVDTNEILYAFDVESGEFLWDYQRETPDFFTIKGGGEPVQQGNTVYLGFADGTVAALAADNGQEQWSVQLGAEAGDFDDVHLPLFVSEERLLATSTSGGIYALERSTGAVEWHVDVSDVTAVHQELNWLFATVSTGRVFALDTTEGEIYWSYDLPGDLIPMGVSIGGSFLAVAVAEGPMYWLHLRNGEPAAKWMPSKGFQSAPVFDDRLGYVMSNAGYLYGFGVAY